jgi:N-acetylglucosamine malate deacetylase 2
VNILAFFAHPDDETMLAGGTLALLAQQGASVHYLCATRGEGGEAGTPPLCERSQLGQLRTQEMDCAVRQLGGRSLAFLDYQDPLVGDNNELFAYCDNVDLLAEQVREHMDRVSASAILSHGSSGEYGHPAHLITHQAALQAVQSKGSAARNEPLFYTVQADFPGHPKPRLANRSDQAHLVLDVSSVIDNKTEAALCHRSQHALFVRRASQEAGRELTVPEVITSLESLHRAWPAADLYDDPLFHLLKLWATG